jgi:hypothetical protein
MTAPACERCGAELSPGALKYRVLIRLTADFDGHLGEGEGSGAEPSLEEQLARAAALSEEELMAGVHRELVFLVCPACRKAVEREPWGPGFLKGPLGVVQ